MKEQFKGSLLLLIGTVIWGCAFVAQSVAMDHIGPFTFQTIRSALAVIVLIPVAAVFDRGRKDGGTFAGRWTDKGLWKTGLACGAALFVASGLQQMGMVYTDPGKAGFLTAMYIVLVPVLGLFLGKRAGRLVWISVAIAAVGLYLLSCVGVNSINIGDVYLMGCALAYAVQITLVDRLAGSLDGVRLNSIQFFVVAVLSAVVMLAAETPSWSGILACAGALLYTGILSSAVGFTLQILGQQRLAPEPASLIMSLESVFAVLAGWLILGQKLSLPESIGCCLVFAAVILSQRQSGEKTAQ